MNKRGSDRGGSGEVDGVSDTVQSEYDSDKNLKMRRSAERKSGIEDKKS